MYDSFFVRHWPGYGCFSSLIFFVSMKLCLSPLSQNGKLINIWVGWVSMCARTWLPTLLSQLRCMTYKCQTIWRFSVSHSTRRWRSTLKWPRQSGLAIFISRPCDSSRDLCFVMLHGASLVSSSDCSCINATLCITTCQTRISIGYRECRMLLHELFAKLHIANTTQPRFLWISIGFRCMAESTTRLPSCYKAVKLQQPLYITGLFSSYRQSRVLRSSTSDLLSTQSSSTNMAARQFSCCPTVWNSLPSFVCTTDSFISFRS